MHVPSITAVVTNSYRETDLKAKQLTNSLDHDIRSKYG